MTTNFHDVDWSTLPQPSDDGSTDHLPGSVLPIVPLEATDGTTVDLSALDGCTVVYAYPRTGQPGVPLPDGWDLIPGARGCTPQSCSFRDHFAQLQDLGVKHLFGLSTQDSSYQREVVERLHLPFLLLSDHPLRLTRALNLPTFDVNGMTLLKRFTLIIKAGKIEHVFYPIFPPNKNAADVIDWFRSQRVV
jgi:peroxiredoxin